MLRSECPALTCCNTHVHEATFVLLVFCAALEVCLRGGPCNSRQHGGSRAFLGCHFDRNHIRSFCDSISRRGDDALQSKNRARSRSECWLRVRRGTSENVTNRNMCSVSLSVLVRLPVSEFESFAPRSASLKVKVVDVNPAGVEKQLSEAFSVHTNAV